MKPRKRGQLWEISYRCPGYSKPIYERFPSFEAAKLRIAEIQYEKSIGQLRPPRITSSKGGAPTKKFITVGELLDEYVTLYGLNHWGDSYLSYSRHRIEHYIKPYLGNVILSDLTAHDLDLYEERQIADRLRSFIKENDLPPVVFHSLRHCSTSIKLRLSSGNIKAVQGDTGHAQARMVTDVYAHINNADRKELAHKIEAEFFQQLNSSPSKAESIEDATEAYQLLQKNPEIAKLIIATLKRTDPS